MKKRIISSLLAATLVMTLVSGCGSTAAESSTATTTEATASESGSEESTTETEAPAGDVKGKADASTLIVGSTADPTTLDPVCAGNSVSVNVLTPVVEQLVKYDPDGNLVPWLAESWEMKEPTVWEFKLRQGVKFHNGEEMKASDVVFSFQRATTDYAANTSYIMNIVDPDNCVAIDDYTVDIATKYQFNPFINYLPYIGASIVSETAYQDEAAQTHPVGTGPFIFDEFVEGDQISYHRFDEYWGGAAGYEKLVIKPIPDNTTRYMALEAGDIDLAIGLTNEEISKIESNPDISMATHPTTVFQSLYFNCDHGPFADVKVRQAVDYALDKIGIVAAVYGDSASFTPGPLAVGENYRSSDEDPHYDVEKAKALIEESGLDLSQEFEICTNEDSKRIAMATIIQSELAEIGMNVVINTLDYASYTDYTASDSNDKQMWFSGWGAVGFPEPDNNLYGPLASSQIPQNNTCLYSNPELDKLLDAERTTPDGSEREAICLDVQKLIREEAPYVPIANTINIIGYRNYVEGFKAMPSIDQNYNTCTIIGQ